MCHLLLIAIALVLACPIHAKSHKHKHKHRSKHVRVLQECPAQKVKYFKTEEQAQNAMKQKGARPYKIKAPA